jgi:hypothetical protein
MYPPVPLPMGVEVLPNDSNLITGDLKSSELNSMRVGDKGDGSVGSGDVDSEGVGRWDCCSSSAGDLELKVCWYRMGFWLDKEP